MKMLHVTIQTKAFEEEIRFYQEIAGLTIDRDLREAGRDLVFLNNGEGETCIEIIRNEDADDAGNQFLSVGFKAEDVEKKREELEALGLSPTPMISPNPSVKFFYVKDPAGVRVQFI